MQQKVPCDLLRGFYFKPGRGGEPMGSLGLSSGAPLLESREKRLHWELLFSLFVPLLFIFLLLAAILVVVVVVVVGSTSSSSIVLPKQE